MCTNTCVRTHISRIIEVWCEDRCRIILLFYFCFFCCVIASCFLMVGWNQLCAVTFYVTLGVLKKNTHTEPFNSKKIIEKKNGIAIYLFKTTRA